MWSVLTGHTCVSYQLLCAVVKSVTCVPLALTISFSSVMPAAMSGRATFLKRHAMLDGTPCISSYFLCSAEARVRMDAGFRMLRLISCWSVWCQSFKSLS
jgi:hypothetical protein